MDSNLQSCPRCVGEPHEHLLHCHEVVVEHADGRLECAGGACVVDVRVHRFVVACTEVDCGDCLEEQVGEVRVADDLPLAA